MSGQGSIQLRSEAACDFVDAECFDVEAAGHTFAFYPDGASRREALIELIDDAESSLHIFYYMFQDDESGQKVLDALVRAADRGITVELIIDDFGSDAPDKFFDPLIDAGGSFRKFSARFSVRYLIRNHQKFAIADEARVMTGGFNISDHYFNDPQRNGWCDLGVKIEGEVVDQFKNWYDLLRDWIDHDGSELRRIRRMVKDWNGGDGAVQLLIGGPLTRKSRWALRFRKDLAECDKLDFVTAYFSPPRSVRRQMRKLAKRGSLRMIVAGVSDIDAAIDVARMHYRKLLRAGAKIFEFQPCKLHMKLLVIDNFSYFGSANLDKRSVRLNVELMVRIEDEALARRLREFIDHMEAASSEVTPEWYQQQSDWFTRLRRRFNYALSMADYRITAGLAG
ncbi:phospholipase D-like domain-containing protein [Erythrobacter rubeus]|uniref:Phospholipase D n=1 Tax=Erythrobacter rubeus TaxID=2760803 RepID=A0ABR8KKB5_9SPHN|nr:phospholipase D-like domain-containing protein [Erythrobacter rubeus]MBD2840662.1 phosphatidylserine/phosphatidylglycerophosphate/cardiolipin synthase family protein [Erythrobacter rubeus]